MNTNVIGYLAGIIASKLQLGMTNQNVMRVGHPFSMNYSALYFRENLVGQWYVFVLRSNILPSILIN